MTSPAWFRPYAHSSVQQKAVRRRPKAAPASVPLREVPAGRSWFYSIRVGDTATLVVTRVSAKVSGTEAHIARANHVQHHHGLSHAEATRLKRKLSAEGLFYAGGPL